jgi:SNF2 family DNA or RNA helicase
MASLLARLKSGGHKCLIFTQMSKMLDILEVRRLGGHVRLDVSLRFCARLAPWCLT